MTELLSKEGGSGDASKPSSEVMVVTCAQKKCAEHEEAILAVKEKQSGARPNKMAEKAHRRKEASPEREETEDPDVGEEPVLGSIFEEELFTGGRERVRLTRREKRSNRIRYCAISREGRL